VKETIMEVIEKRMNDTCISKMVQEGNRKGEGEEDDNECLGNRIYI
jgi:hypothetical protein